VKGTAEALGNQSLGRDLGIEMGVSIYTDSSAAAGIWRRSGMGRGRHSAVGQLWAQEGLRRGDFKLDKIPGTDNPADLLTKHVAKEIIERHVESMVWPVKMDGRDGTGSSALETAPEDIRPYSKFQVA
jgi:hypothetical protein